MVLCCGAAPAKRPFTWLSRTARSGRFLSIALQHICTVQRTAKIDPSWSVATSSSSARYAADAVIQFQPSDGYYRPSPGIRRTRKLTFERPLSNQVSPFCSQSAMGTVEQQLVKGSMLALRRCRKNRRNRHLAPSRIPASLAIMFPMCPFGPGEASQWKSAYQVSSLPSSMPM